MIVFLLGAFAILTSLSGAIAGEIYGRKPMAVMFGDGPALVAALTELPAWLYVSAIAPVVACYLLWSRVSVGVSLILPGIKPLDLCTILWVASFVSISDLRTRFTPDIVMVPFLVFGVLHGLPHPAAVASSAEAACLVMIFRYVIGAVILALSITFPRWQIQRVHAVIYDGDWVIIAACAAWVGMAHVLDVVLLSAILPLLIIAPGFVPVIRTPARAVASRFLDVTYLPHEEEEQRPPGMPLAGPLMLGLVIEEILVHAANGHFQPANLLLHLISH